MNEFRTLRQRAERLPGPVRDFALELLAGLAGVVSSHRATMETLDRRLHQQRQADQQTLEGLRAQIGALEVAVATMPRQADQATIRDMRAAAVMSHQIALRSAGATDRDIAAASMALENYLLTVEAIMLRNASAAVAIVAAHYTTSAGDER